MTLDSPRILSHLIFGDADSINSPANWIINNIDAANAVTNWDNNLTLGSNGTVTVNALGANLTNGTATIAANISDGVDALGSPIPSTLTKLGPGTLSILYNASANANYSGGTILNEGRLVVGYFVASTVAADLQAASQAANGRGLGAGSITFSNNTILELADANTNDRGGAGSGNVSNPLLVPAGQTATLLAPGRYTLSSPLTGSGTLLLRVNYVRGDVSGDWSGFTGRIKVYPRSATSDFRIANVAGFPAAAINLTTNAAITAGSAVWMYSRAAANSIIPIGELSGDQGATLNSGAGSGAGQAFAVIYQVGGLNSTATFAGNLIGNVGIIKEGTGVWILTGTNNITTGGMIINSGTVQVGGGGIVGTLGRTAVVTNNATLAFNRSDSLAVTNVIEGSGALVQQGAGTVTLLPATGANLYVGKTVINAGTLTIANQSALGGDPGIFTADQLTLNGGALLVTNSLSMDLASRGITLGASGGTFGAAAGMTLTIAQTIAGSGALTVKGAGTVSLSDANTYSGKTILNSGTLAMAAPSVLGSAPGAFVADQLTFNGGTLQSTTSLAMNDGKRGITLGDSGGTFNPDADTTLTVANRIAGNGSLAINGPGTLALSGVNTYTGSTLVSQGKLAISGSGSIANSPLISVAAGATLDVSTASGFALATGQILAGNGIVTGNLPVANGATISPGSSIGLLTVSGNLLMSGGANMLVDLDISKATNDQIVIQGNLNLSGINTLSVNLLSALSPGRYPLIRHTGARTGGAANLVLAGISGSRLTATLDDQVANEIALVISGSAASLTWLGDGNLNAWDTATQNWLLSGSPASFSTGDNVIFDDSGSSYPAVNLVGALAPGAVAVNAAITYTFAGDGKITGPASLTKTNTGTLILVTRNDYFGQTVIGGGTIQVGNGIRSGTLGTGDVLDNATLFFNLPDSVTNTGVISGTGSLMMEGSGTLTLPGNNTYQGPTTINSGSVQVGAGGNSGSLGSGDVSNNGSLVFNRSGSLTNLGAISGTGLLTVQGSGTVVLPGNNSFSGLTTVDKGTLQIGTGGAAGALEIASVTLTNNGTIAFNRSGSVTNPIVISGDGQLLKQGSGMLTLTSDNTYGPTIIDAGALQIGDGGVSSGTGSLGMGDVTDNGALIFNRPDAMVVSNSISGVGTLIHIGLGTLTLRPPSSGNHYSGGTIISNSTVILESIDTANNVAVGNSTGLGMGPVTFYGGTLQMFGYNGSTTPDYGGNSNSFVVPTNQTGTILLPSRITVPGLIGAVSGAGTLNLVVNYVRGNIGGDWTNFTGLISVGPKSAADEFRINNFGFPNADLYLSNGVTMYNIGGNNRIIDLGGLAGEIGAVLGTGNQNSSGPTWRVGGKNTTNTFAGLINDAGTTSLIKAGSGKWTLTGANSYTGSTTVSNGVLALKDEGSIANSLTINIVSNAVLQVAERVDGTLTLNGAQVLTGEGTIEGSLIASGGTTVSPGADVGLVGRLTITNALTLQEGSVLQVDVDGEARTCDTLVGMANVTYGGTLSLNGTFAADSNLKLFDAAAYSGAFASISPDPPGQDLKWDTTQLTVSGTLKVLSTILRPAIGAFQVVGTNLVINGTGGTPSGSFEVLTSQEVTLPLSQWTVAATGQFDGSGNFSFTVPLDPKQVRRFYAIKM